MGPKYFMNNDHRAKEASPEVQAALHQIPLVPQTTTTEGIDREGQGCCSRGRVSVIKVDSDGASCQDVVCHVNRFLLQLLLLRRPAHASPAALGAARGLVQRPAHEDAAGSVHSPGSHRHCCQSTSHTVPRAQGPRPASPSTAKPAAPCVSLRALSRAPG